MLAFGSSPLTYSINCDFSWKLFCLAIFIFKYQLSYCNRISLRTLSLSIQGSSSSCQSFSCQSLGSIFFAFLLDLRQVSDSDLRARGSLSKLFLLLDENCLRLRLDVLRLDFLPSSLGESLPTSFGMRQSLAILGTSRQSYSRKLLLFSRTIASGYTISQTNALVSIARYFGNFLLVQMPSINSQTLSITSLIIIMASALLLQLYIYDFNKFNATQAQMFKYITYKLSFLCNVLEKQSACVSLLFDQLVPTESVQDHRTHILRLYCKFQEVQKRAQLLVPRIMVVGDHWNCILRLQEMAIRRIVNQNNILRASIDYPQILQIISLLQGAMLPVQSMRDELLLGVKMVQHHIGI